MDFIGKYVCFGKEDMFCWGKIKSVVTINTAEGLKQAFVLTERMSGPHGGCQKIVRNSRDTLLRIDQIDLERDIIDSERDVFRGLSDEDLFLMVLQNDVLERKPETLSKGAKNMICSGYNGSESDWASRELKERMGIQGSP